MGLTSAGCGANGADMVGLVMSVVTIVGAENSGQAAETYLFIQRESNSLVKVC